jgi:hypothetical protein
MPGGVSPNDAADIVQNCSKAPLSQAAETVAGDDGLTDRSRPEKPVT